MVPDSHGWVHLPVEQEGVPRGQRQHPDFDLEKHAVHFTASERKSSEPVMTITRKADSVQGWSLFQDIAEALAFHANAQQAQIHE
jgi:hypothetical protein